MYIRKHPENSSQDVREITTEVKNRNRLVYVERNKESVPEVLNPFKHTEQPAEVAAVGAYVPSGHNVQISSFLTYVPVTCIRNQSIIR
jgi:hypothetical protein